MQKGWARLWPDEQKAQARQAVQRIIAQGGVWTVFQPIFSLALGELMGYEALSRGPAGSPWESPPALFKLAEEGGMVFQLEQTCRETALARAAELNLPGKVFLNITPRVLQDPEFRSGTTRHLLARLGIDPRRIVIEITEREAIHDYRGFVNTLKYYRDQGYLVAVDDFGAGYTSFQSILELQPDFIKIDMSFIRGIDFSRTRRIMVETLVNLANRLGVQTIAEGIETESELKVLIELGVDFGQGYFLGRPAEEPPTTDEKISRLILNQHEKKQIPLYRRILKVGDIAQPYPAVFPQEPVRGVVALFEQNEGVHGVAVVQEEEPVGLVMKDKLYFRLGQRFGYSVFMERPVELVMDRRPLIVDLEMPLDQVSRMAMSRDESRLYDYIIVREGQRYVGMVSVRRLLDTITASQVELARCANPLTGLPGNIVIEDEINSRLTERAAFSVLYVDIDNFKAFNDVYGFERGDEAIKLLAAVLNDAVAKLGRAGSFVGHVGGDDFIVVTGVEECEAVAAMVIEEFDRRVPALYREEDRRRGYIVAEDRRGLPATYPLMTISIACIVNQEGEGASYAEFVHNVAELKRYAKSKPGSVYVVERRKRKGDELDGA
ncbi:MAG: GGDEF domain-containing protein [Bacillota bacterium]|nr:GGDEF domain-containing protein [Bacillota bacterium]